jgi:CheY-like chemotaxis protein
VVAVRDNGAGITAEMLPKVFDPFVQAERTFDRSHGGLRLGLTLVKHLVELHGGRVGVTSEGAGRGSEFTVRLPVPADIPPGAEAGKRTAPADAYPPGTAVRVLVVDDSAANAQSMAMWLRGLGHEVWVAGDGPPALAQAERHRPQLVLLDIGLPGVSGYGVAARLRQLPGVAHARIVALTGYGQEKDRRRAEEAGFDGYLVKPADPAALQRLLSSLSRRQGLANPRA